MKKADYRDADLLIRLYDLRREEVLRKARKWVASSQFECQSYEEFSAKYSPESEENAYLGMTISYWDMVCALVDRGLLNEELFFSTTYEHMGVWQKVAAYVAGGRKAYDAPSWCASLEKVVLRHQAWFQSKKAPAKRRARTKQK